MKVKQLISKLEEMLAYGEITPDSEITIAHYSNGKQELIEDLDIWGLDYIYFAEDSPVRILEIQAYNEPLNPKNNTK